MNVALLDKLCDRKKKREHVYLEVYWEPGAEDKHFSIPAKWVATACFSAKQQNNSD